jgi:hypothetical protein
MRINNPLFPKNDNELLTFLLRYRNELETIYTQFLIDEGVYGRNKRIWGRFIYK